MMTNAPVRIVSALAALAGLAFPALSQLIPDRLYTPVGRPLPVNVRVPEGQQGTLTIKLLEPGTANEKAKAEITPGPNGKIDLGKVFPALWTDKNPPVVYAQLFAGETPIGPALVVQPLNEPGMARAINDGSGRPRIVFDAAPPEARTMSGVRTYTDKHVVLDTTHGEIEFRLRPDEAPNTVWNFMHLVDGGFYTDIKVHRIVPTGAGGQPFVFQFGCPLGDGRGGPGFQIDLEPSKLKHDFGVLSMARTNDPNTNGSQVFVCLSREATSFLDGLYTGFGEAVRGEDTIIKIQNVELAGPQTPKEPPVVKSAKLIDAPPYGTGPKPVTRPAAPATPR
jgi:peptidyl-prolyl cis-trans isomerase B (cyclophilin B)